MMNINDSEFLESFDVSKCVVGIMGYGYVGQAVENFFSTECTTRVYDKFKPKLSDSLEAVVRDSHVIFVCVPTPMNNDGSCHTGIVEEVLQTIVDTAHAVDRSSADFIVVMKSTVYPGFTESMKARHPQLRVMFSPEFLTEKNSFEDFEKMNRLLLGGDLKDCQIVARFFENKLRDAVLLKVDPTVAELAKLFTNAFLMTKVMFANEMYKVCEAMGVDYKEVYLTACLDQRITTSHLSVPGHDGKFGAGGSCFPKDINNLRNVAKKLGTGEKLFSAVIERNVEVRGSEDWKELTGRAVLPEEDK